MASSGSRPYIPLDDAFEFPRNRCVFFLLISFFVNFMGFFLGGGGGGGFLFSQLYLQLLCVLLPLNRPTVRSKAFSGFIVFILSIFILVGFALYSFYVG